MRLVEEIAVNGVPRAFCESVVLSDSGFEITFAKKRKFSAARGMSIIRAAPTVLPWSRDSKSARRSRLASMRSAILKMNFARDYARVNWGRFFVNKLVKGQSKTLALIRPWALLEGGKTDQLSKAASALFTAFSTSSAFDLGTKALWENYCN